MEFVEEASHFGFRLEEPEVQTGSQVPLRPPPGDVAGTFLGKIFERGGRRDQGASGRSE